MLTFLEALQVQHSQVNGMEIFEFGADYSIFDVV